MYWEKLLKDIRKSGELHYSYLLQDWERSSRAANRPKPSVVRSGPSRIYLGKKYPNVYFTRRETECVIGLLRGWTVKEVAMRLALSNRTVEYYIKNIKAKVSCRTRSQLISRVISSDFIETVRQELGEDID